MTPYDLWYWPSIPGRGEFVRLPMEAAQIPYRDRAREAGEAGEQALIADLKARGPRGPFAPPYLDTGCCVIAQTVAILAWLGEHHTCAPADEAGRAWAMQLALTVADMVAEVHNVHHPVDVAAYYEEQRGEATRAAHQFREARLPKFLAHFERAAAADAGGPFVLGGQWSYADTSLFQLIAGLRYMFPRRMAALEPDLPRLIALHDAVAALPPIAAYAASGRRIPFNEDGIFRHYPELDGD